MKHTEGNSLEIAGVLIAIGFVAAWLTASGVTGRSNNYLPAAQTSSEMNISLVRAHSDAMQTATLAASTMLVVKGDISTRNPNALEAKFAMQRRLEALDGYVSQQGGSVTLGDVRYTRAGKTGEFIAAQQLEIRLPDLPSDAAYQHKLIRLGVQLNSVERIAQISEAK